MERMRKKGEKRMLKDKTEGTNEVENGIVKDERKSRKRIGYYAFNKRVIWASLQAIDIRRSGSRTARIFDLNGGEIYDIIA